MPGHRYRTGIDMVEVESVDVVEPSSVDAAQAREAGYASAGELLADLRGDPALPVYRIRLRRIGRPDPRDELARAASLTEADVAIMATMPDVKVTHTTTAGQPTLTLADSWPKLTGGLVESLVINASTGFPVALFNRDPGQPLNATYYHTFRVTLANVEAGKF